MSKPSQLLLPEKQTTEDTITHKTVTISSPDINFQLAAEESVPTQDDQPDVWQPVVDCTIMRTYTPNSHTGTLPAMPHSISSPEAMQLDINHPELQPTSANSLTTCWPGVTQPGAPIEEEATDIDKSLFTPPACSLTTCWLELPKPEASSPVKWSGTPDMITASLINNLKEKKHKRCREDLPWPAIHSSAPPWLLQQPVMFPPQPSSAALTEVQDEDAKPQLYNLSVDPAELMEATKLLIQESQSRSFLKQLNHLTAITFSSTDHLTRLLFRQHHLQSGHCGLITLRAADVQVERAMISTDYKTRSQLAQQTTNTPAVYKRPVCNLFMPPSEEVPEPRASPT